VISLADEIARNMSAASVRVATVQAQRDGIELPNASAKSFTSRIAPRESYNDFSGTSAHIARHRGAPEIADLSRMPHLLIAGQRGGQIGGDQHDDFGR
jgi:S-DNA-T family DNA segregation ATPase FtsK/SpoIIIE